MPSLFEGAAFGTAMVFLLPLVEVLAAVQGLAVCFLATGLASVGVPGTIGFVPVELLIGGSAEQGSWVSTLLERPREEPEAPRGARAAELRELRGTPNR